MMHSQIPIRERNTDDRIRFTAFIVIISVWIVCLGASAYLIHYWLKSTVRETAVVRISRDLIKHQSEGKFTHFYELTPGVHEDTNTPPWVEGRILYTVSSQSFRSTKQFAMPKPASVYRIAALGDSFTFGLYITDGQVWTDKLEEILTTDTQCRDSGKTFEVVNLGVPGYDLSYDVERYARHAADLSPDMVLWMVKDDDFSQNNEIMDTWVDAFRHAIPQFVQNAGIRAGMSIPMNIASYQYNRIFGSSAIRSINTATLERFRRLHQGRFLFLTDRSIPSQYLDVMESISRKGANSGVLFVLDPTIPDFPDGHPTAAGHAKIARILADYLIHSGICSKPSAGE